MYLVSTCKILNNSLECVLQSVEILEENMIFLYKKGSIQDIVGYYDTDWAGSKNDRRIGGQLANITCFL